MTLTAQNLEERRSGIGASEIGAVCGIPGSFGTPMSVYESKVSPAPEREETEAMAWGNAMEPVILGWLRDKHGLTVEPNAVLARHPAHPFAVATPDGYLMEDGRRVAVVEVKAPSWSDADWRDPDDDPQGAPLIYRVQVQWQMLVTGLPRAILAALVNRRLWIYHFDADPEAQADMLQDAAAFWKRVESRDPPLDGMLTGSDCKVLARLIRQSGDGLAVPASDEAAELLRLAVEFRRAREASEAAQAVADSAKARLCAAIGTGAGLDLGTMRVTWKATKGTAATDWKAVAAEMKAPAEVVQRHTTISTGSRRFLVSDVKPKASRAKKEH